MCLNIESSKSLYVFEPFLIYKALEGTCDTVTNWQCLSEIQKPFCRFVVLQGTKPSKLRGLCETLLLARWKAREKDCVSGEDLVHRQNSSEIRTSEQPRLGKTCELKFSGLPH